MSVAGTTSVKLDAKTRNRLKRLAGRRHRAPDWLMREAIEQYVEREERRQSFREDALTAWREYQANGLHVTADEVDAWLTGLEAGEDVDPPVPHD